MNLTVEQALRKALAAHRAGKLDDAERLYRVILKLQPSHADANHNLGLIIASANNFEAALPFLETALKINPRVEQFWLSFIRICLTLKKFERAEVVIEQAKKNGITGKKLYALIAELNSISTLSNVSIKGPSQEQLRSLVKSFQNGQLIEAEKLAKSITQDYPANKIAWKVLGAVLKQTGKMSDSLVACQKSVLLAPRDAETHYNLGNTLLGLGKFDEAEASFKKAITLNPDYTAAYSNLGYILRKLDRLEEDKQNFSKVMEFEPQHAGAHYNLAVTLQDLGEFQEAETCYRRTIELAPENAEAHSNLGVLLKESGRLEEAETSYVQAIALRPNYAEAHSNLGNTLKQMGKLEQAEASFLKAITLEPRLAEAHNNLGLTLQELGRLAEARASYIKALALKPDYAAAHRHLTTVKKFEVKDEQYLKMDQLIHDKALSEDQRCHINFGLAKACEDLGEYAQAFAYYYHGNAERKKLLRYDIAQDIYLFKQIESHHPQIFEYQLKLESVETNLVPIFIVGMPRSGTTLVEQIISSHAKVTGAGELPFVDRFGGQLATGATKTDNITLLNFRECYLKKLQNVSQGNSVVSDKMPQNFRYLGLIATAFPEAKVIHVKRDPSATCWANYKQYFTSNDLGFCYSLSDIINYYNLYQDLMRFWQKLQVKPLYDLNYELLTTNQEEETKRLIDYLGLDWDESCLSPENNSRSVTTASNTQIRQKIYQNSSRQWEKYRPFLRGALDNFD